MTRRAALLPFLLLGFAACGGSQESHPAQDAQAVPAAAPAATAAAAPAAPAPDSAVGAISSRGTAVPEAGAPTGPSVPPSGPAAGNAGIHFDLPSGWVSEAPKSNMRLAQATIPGPAGSGELAVFYFGAGRGGGVEANIERWIDQVEAPAGAPKPERGTLEAHGLRVSWVDVHGTLKPSSMGMGPSTSVPDARLFGAVIEGPGGPWFFKATGPDKTLAPQREAFFTMVKSVRSAANT
jgi:hypothetical protein